MASMPELGSKISLISKSDIRYEGQLYTVDPNECTIALANVRSYGTEDRDGQFSIPPQEEIFDYILFRGSDIKDIRVVNNVPRVPHDPAIMQMHVSAQNQSNFQPQFSMPPVMPNVGGQVGPFGGANNQPGPFGAMSAPNAPHGGQLPQVTPGLPFGQPQSQPSQQQQQTPQQSTGQQQQQPQNNQQPQQKNSVLDLIGGGSRSTTPVSLNSRKSPTAEMGIQVNQKDGTRRNNNRGQGGRLDSQGSHENRNQQRNNQYQGNNQNRGGNWSRNNNQNSRNNQRPQRRPGMHPQSFRQNNQNTKGRPKTTIKFESDFDFEQANTKFEEMRLSLAKLKVGEENKTEQVNGEAEKKDDSGNETGAGEQEQEEDDVTVGYDKAKSFFDNISCEAATDRKGKNRTDWRLERKLNSETFGVSSARRGGFYNYNRGRPGNNGNYYNNNNRNGNYRNNGYNNGGNNYRGGNFRNTRNFNQRNQNQGNNQQNENPTTSLPQEKQPSNQQSQPTAAQAPAVAAGGK